MVQVHTHRGSLPVAFVRATGYLYKLHKRLSLIIAFQMLIVGRLVAGLERVGLS